jgi:hypothetical protein
LTQNPFTVEECGLGTGAACGSVYLDKVFEELVREKFGEYTRPFLTNKRLATLVRHFDSSIKREYNPYSEDCDDEFEIPVAGAMDIPEINLEDGYLRLSKSMSLISL